MAEMTKLMRCHTPHWQGNDFIPDGAVYPAGHPRVIPIYFEQLEVAPAVAGLVDDGEPPPPPARRPGRPKLPRDTEGNIVRDSTP
jgi:hypothetical protein